MKIYMIRKDHKMLIQTNSSYLPYSSRICDKSEPISQNFERREELFLSLHSGLQSPVASQSQPAIRDSVASPSQPAGTAVSSPSQSQPASQDSGTSPGSNAPRLGESPVPPGTFCGLGFGTVGVTYVYQLLELS
jgi:hypothetical protein